MDRKISIITAILFCAILFGFAFAFIIIPDSDFSEQENRTLQQFPEFNMNGFLNGDFGREMNDYYADQFPARDAFVGVKGISELALLKGGNNGVLLGKGGQLAVYKFTAYESMTNSVPDTDGYFESTVSRGMSAIVSLDKALAEKGIEVCAVVAPRTLDVASSAFDYPDESSVELRDLVKSGLSGVNAPDVISLIKEKYDAGEYVTYRTDHHWTTLGAYYAYREIMESFGMDPHEIDDFSVEKYDGFYGTTWSRAGMKFIGADTLEIWSLGNESDFTLLDIDTGESFPGFYDYSYLSVKDKYGAFLGGTRNRLLITKNCSEDRELLIVAKDSFANSVIPFLAQHFDILVLNLSDSGDEINISGYAEKYSASRVLILYGLENIISSSRLSKIR